MRRVMLLGALALPLGAACSNDPTPYDPYGSFEGGSPYNGVAGDGEDSSAVTSEDSSSPPSAEAGTGDAQDAAFPPISAATPARAAAVCAGGAPPGAYLLAANGTIFAFDPGSLELRSLGTLSCTTSAFPEGFSVTTTGTAYVLYSDGTLYSVRLDTLACQPTPYQSGPLALDSLRANVAAGGIAVGAGDTADRLYFYGLTNPAILGISDVTDFLMFDVGAGAQGPAGLTVDLAADAYGRLFTLDPGGTLYELDPSTGAVLGADFTGYAPSWVGLNAATGISVLPYGGQLYLIGGMSGGVNRYDIATKALYPIGALNQVIIGASATPCLPGGAGDGGGPPAPEGGADGGSSDGGEATGDAADDGETDGGSAAAPANAFAAGDAWIGTFVCGQGLTHAALVVESIDGAAVKARFDFAGVGSAQGSYEIAGTYDPGTREATFTPGAWVSQPNDSDSAAVGLDGHVDLAGTSFAGTITASNCGAFSVTR